MVNNTIKNTFIYVLLLSIFQAMRFYDEELDKPVFIITNIIFTIYVITQIYSLRNEKRWLLNPLFLASLRMFLLAYGATIFYFYLEDRPLDQYIKVNNLYSYLNNAMIYASIGFITMWHSYNSEMIKRYANSFINLITRQTILLRSDLEPRWIIVYAIFFLSITFKLILISLGIYGVIGTILAENTEAFYMNYVVAISSAGSGVLLFLNLYFFKTGKKKTQFIVFFLIDFFFSIITGYKGAIIMSVLVVAVAYYLVHEKIKYSFVLIVICTISFAYAIISPYRYYIQTETNFEKNSITSIVNAFINSYKSSNNTKSESDKNAMLKRFNFLPELTKFQEYKTEHGLRQNDPDFLYITLTAPIQIFIPRYLWKEKPKADLGRVWVTQKLFQRDYNSSTAFGPIGFLYMTGGVFAIIVGFIIVGFFLQVVNLFLKSNYWGGIIITLALLSSTTSLEGQFNFYITDFIQILILSLIFQYVLLKNKKYNWQQI